MVDMSLWMDLMLRLEVWKAVELTQIAVALGSGGSLRRDLSLIA